MKCINKDCINCGRPATHPQLLFCDKCYKIYIHIKGLSDIRNKKGLKNNDFKNIRDACIERVNKKYKG